jgi:hypothetical protein
MRMDSLLYGTSAKNIQKLQRVQNGLARAPPIYSQGLGNSIISSRYFENYTSRPDHAQGAERRTASLPQQPHDRVQADEAPEKPSPLGFSGALASRASKCAAGLRTFTRASEAVWKKLPEDIRISVDLQSFKTKLKTYFVQLLNCGEASYIQTCFTSLATTPL